MTLKEVVEAIKHLPGIYFSGIRFDDSPEKALITVAEIQQKSIGLWLEYYLLEDRQEWYFEVHKEPVSHYKPKAEIIRIIYSLIQEIKLLSPLFQGMDINNLLFLISREIFEAEMINAGIHENPTLEGKRTRNDRVKGELSAIEAVHKLENTGLKRTSSPIEMLINEAITIAKIEENNQFREKWRRFLADVNKWETRIRKSKLQGVYLHKGFLIVNAQGKRKTSNVKKCNDN